jgi:hypothetical protein
MNNENPELDRIIEEVCSELRNILLKRRELIEKLGFAFEKVVANKESICEEIKNCLKEEIASDIISSRTIEQSCRPEWKKKTRPKLENEKISFSHDKPEEEEEKKRKIIIDNHGSPVQDKAESDSSAEVDSRQDANGTAHQDNELLQRTIRELIYENKKIRQEKNEIQVKLGEALESLHVQKQRESEQVKKDESTYNRLEPHQSVFDAEFSVDYKPLQNHMAGIYKSPSRQEVWFTLKIDANKKKVASAQIGRKLLPQNVTETGK